MKLVNVYEDAKAIPVLYELLKERTPEQSISHKGMPTFEQHSEFVRRRPYTAWYLLDVMPETLGMTYEQVVFRDKRADWVGAVYLTQRREIGIFIFNAHHGKGYGTEAVKLLRAAHPGPIYANIAPRNLASRQFFKKMGFRHLQDTYVID